jgi:hypothetical protein
MSFFGEAVGLQSLNLLFVYHPVSNQRAVDNIAMKIRAVLKDVAVERPNFLASAHHLFATAVFDYGFGVKGFHEIVDVSVVECFDLMLNWIFHNSFPLFG